MKILTVCACGLLLSGCGTIINSRAMEPATPIGGFGVRVGTAAPDPTRAATGRTVGPADAITINVVDMINQYSGAAPPPGSIEAAIAAFDGAKLDETHFETARNEIVGAVLMASDKNCEVYIEYLHGNQILIRGVSGVLATALSGAAAVTTPASSSRVLAALGGGASGIGADIDSALFSKMAVETLSAGIRADRAEAFSEIKANMGQPYAKWPLTVALRDAVQYHNRCDAISGLTYLQGAAAQNKAAAEQNQAPNPKTTIQINPATTAGTVTTTTVGGAPPPVTPPPTAAAQPAH